MAKINWTVESRSWLKTNYDFIAADNPFAAEKTIERIINHGALDIKKYLENK